MNVIACYSIKGGVGKTTTAINLSYLSAASGSSTLLWDLDLQGSASLVLSTNSPEKKSHKLLTTKKVDLNDHIQQTQYANLHFLPSDFSLYKVDQRVNGSSKNDLSIKYHLKSFRKKYKYVILDCASGYNSLTQHILHVADVILSPVIPSPFSFDALEQLKKQLRKKSERANAAVSFFLHG